MRLIQRISSIYSCGFAALALAAVVVGCASSTPPPAKQADPKAQSGATGALTDPLRISDRVKIEIFGTPEIIPASEQEIGGDGTVGLDLIGRVQAAGKTPVQVAKDIQDALVPKYYAHAAVTVTPSGRFFYVGGEVNGGGSGGGRIIYSGPITLTRAIDAAGGFNPFANRKKVRLTRVDGTTIIVNCRKAVLKPEDDPPVYPGDTIFIPRRF
jgi:protein involved in polysaccharide export with SLBB domain